jgi:hypothetical protein
MSAALIVTIRRRQAFTNHLADVGNPNHAALTAGENA